MYVCRVQSVFMFKVLWLTFLEKKRMFEDVMSRGELF